VQRGVLQIAIFDCWAKSALAQRLRKELEDQFGPDTKNGLRKLGQARDKLFSTKLEPEERKRLLHEDASEEAFKAFLKSRRKSKRSS